MRITKTRGNLPLFILGLVIVALFFGIYAKQQSLSASAVMNFASADDAGDAHFVTIFDNGEKTVLRSSAETVREVLERADIVYDSDDKVEPSLDEKITEDNFNINIYRARELVVIDGTKEMFVRTPSTDLEMIAADAGVKLLPADRVELVAYDKFMETGMRNAYRVVRAKTVNLDFNGKVSAIRTQAKTVSEFLAEQNIDANPAINWDALSTDTVITDNLALAVYLQGKHTITLEEEIPFTETVTQDFSLNFGTRNVTKAGVPGKKNVVYEVEMHDGVILSKEFISEVIVSEPIGQEVTVGMKLDLPAGSHEDWMAQAGIAASDYGYVNFIISHESGWRTTASNGRYYGLYQTSLGRLQSDCPNWQNDPVCQLRSATAYANGRYGGWENAYHKWQAQHWW